MTILVSKEEKLNKDFVILNSEGNLEKVFFPRLETPRNLELEKELPYNVIFFSDSKAKAEIVKEKISLEDAEEIDWKLVSLELEALGFQDLLEKGINDKEIVSILEKKGLAIAVNLKN